METERWLGGDGEGFVDSKIDDAESASHEDETNSKTSDDGCLRWSYAWRGKNGEQSGSDFCKQLGLFAQACHHVFTAVLFPGQADGNSPPRNLRVGAYSAAV